MSDEFKYWLVERFIIEREKFDRSGVYAYTQCALGYNSNKIEGSALTQEQTVSLFDSGMLPKSDNFYRARDIEEMNGHFLMFNYMIDTIDQGLTQGIIKHMHCELEVGVFEKRASNYVIGDYKQRPNMVGMYKTALPGDVSREMSELLAWYWQQDKTIATLAEFHARYEMIHPFQDGNGRTGRMILFRESLKSDQADPFIITDDNRSKYIEGLTEYRTEHRTDKLQALIKQETDAYRSECEYFR